MNACEIHKWEPTIGRGFCTQASCKRDAVEVCYRCGHGRCASHRKGDRENVDKFARELAAIEPPVDGDNAKG